MAPLPVIYEDEALIAFDKPSGLAVAPDRRDPKAEHLMGLVRAQWGPDVANVHRLDADTSGLVLCAKTKVALDFLSGQFQSKTVVKTHHALTVGLPAADTFAVDLVIKDGGTKPMSRMLAGQSDTERCTPIASCKMMLNQMLPTTCWKRKLRRFSMSVIAMDVLASGWRG